MARRRASALAEDRERLNEEEPRTSPQQGPQQKPWKVAMLLWGFPLIFFVTMAVLKECGGVSFW